MKLFQDTLSKPSAAPWLCAVLVFLAAALVSVVAIDRLAQRAAQDERLRASVIAKDYAATLQSALERDLSATYALAALVRQGNGHIRDFEGIASAMLPLYPGVAVLGLAPHGVISTPFPLQGNEVSLGLDLLNDPLQGKEARLARDSRQLTLAGPVNLVQGGIGLVGRLPVFLPQRKGPPLFWGLVYAVLQLPQTLSNTRLNDLGQHGLDYTLWRLQPDNGLRQTIASSQALALLQPVEHSLRVANGQWTLGVAPQGGWGQSADWKLSAMLGLALSLTLAYAAKLVMQLHLYRRGLEATVAERTREIKASRTQLQATLDAIPDLVLEIAADGSYLVSHVPASGAERLSQEVFKGFSIPADLPAEAAHSVLAAVQDALQGGHCITGEICISVGQRPLWLEMSLVRKAAVANQPPRCVALWRDISLLRARDEEIRRLAFFDALTQLPNRRLLRDRLQQAQTLSQRSGYHGALQFIDLDDFKTLNDSLGHVIGDQLLQEVAARLLDCVRQGDTVARLGGDEFVVLLTDLHSDSELAAAQAEQVGEKILHVLEKPFPLADQTLHITASLGITLLRGAQESIDVLLKQADMAMYQAKEAGRNTLRFFDPAMQSVISARLALETDMRAGLQAQQFVIYLQPQIGRDGQVFGAEVLLRWLHPVRGMVAPNQFIALAEDTGLILPLGEWVLRESCKQLVIWAEQAPYRQLSLSVNVSARQFRQRDFVAKVLSILQATGANPRRLKLELTENLLVRNMDETIAKMSTLKAHGVGFSLDDFGTGYSSLAYLKRLPLDQLKIDQSFVRDLLTDPNDAAIARTVVTLGHSLGLTEIAEGVEAREQQRFLSEQNCDAY